MSDLIQSFISEFKSAPSFEAQKKIEKLYVEHYQERPFFQTELLDLIKNGPKTDVQWSVFFHFDNAFLKEIYLAEQERQAIENFRLCQSEKKVTALVEMAADMGYMNAKLAKEEINPQIGEKIENIWKKTFKELPLFEKSWAENEELTAKMYAEYLHPSSEKEKPETVSFIKVMMPLLVTNSKNETVSLEEFNELSKTPEYAEFMAERVDFFNQFRLTDYMDIGECHDITLSVNGNMNTFTLSLNKEVSLIKLAKSLFGQISDGLGDSLAQRPLLVKDEIYYFGFDYKKFEYTQSPNVPTRKMKM